MPDRTTSQRESASPIDVRAYRQALGQFPTGVCIASAPGCGDHPEPFAITVSSFVSVSLQPPLIAWCLQHGSSTFDLWAQSDHFALSVLAADQGALCDRYALRGNQAMPADLTHRTSPAGNPWIVDAVANFDATVVARHVAGDHDIIIAEVSGFRTDPERPALLYHQGTTRGAT